VYGQTINPYCKNELEMSAASPLLPNPEFETAFYKRHVLGQQAIN
jgi:hypothetical protein